MIPKLEPYELSEFDFYHAQKDGLVCERTCFLCGHHVMVKDAIEVGSDSVGWTIIHNDSRICLALTKRHDLRMDKFLREVTKWFI